jgi:hypothetical protein
MANDRSPGWREPSAGIYRLVAPPFSIDRPDAISQRSEVRQRTGVYSLAWNIFHPDRRPTLNLFTSRLIRVQKKPVSRLYRFLGRPRRRQVAAIETKVQLGPANLNGGRNLNF